MRKNLKMKLTKLWSIVLIAILCISAATTNVSAADYNPKLREDAYKINEILKEESYQIQVTRKSPIDPNVSEGQCHLCALTNLLNRKLALDGAYSTENLFELEYVARINCLANWENDLTKEEAEKVIECRYVPEKKELICKYDTGGYEYSPILSVGTKDSSNNYKAIVIKNEGIEANPEAQIADLLDKHHEGVFVRAIYNKNLTDLYDEKKPWGHCIVVTGYEKDDEGNYQFTVIDTGKSDYEVDEPLTKSWIGGKMAYYGKKVKLNSDSVNKIVYLEKTEDQAAFIKAGTEPTGGSTEDSTEGPTEDSITVDFDLKSIPTTLTKGYTINLAGTISSDKTITNAKAKIIQGDIIVNTNPLYDTDDFDTVYFKGDLNNDSSSELVDVTCNQILYYAEVTPNSMSVNIETSDLNYYLPFEELDAGSYTLEFTATADGETFISEPYSFTVIDPTDDSDVVDFDLTSMPSTHIMGNIFNLEGTIKSNNSAIITNATVKIMQNGKEEDSVSITPKATSVVIRSSELNRDLSFSTLDAGKYTLVYTATVDGKTYTSEPHSFTVVDPTTVGPIVVFDLKSVPKELSLRSSYSLKGTIYSPNSTITNATVKVMQNGEEKSSVSISNNDDTIDIESSALNNDLRFGDLAAGDYSLVYTATAGGKTFTSESYDFTIKASTTVKNSITVTPTVNFLLTSVPSTLNKGAAFNLAGTISSTSTITKATAKIMKNGSTLYTATVTPNAKSVNVKTSNLNYKLPFGKLSAGSYTLVFTATAGGKTFTSKTYNFTVKQSISLKTI